MVLFSGYAKNFYKKDDEILVFHAHELPAMPAAPYPCKFTFYLLTLLISYQQLVLVPNAVCLRDTNFRCLSQRAVHLYIESSVTVE